jgi:hypothetical protein
MAGTGPPTQSATIAVTAVASKVVPPPDASSSGSSQILTE